MTPDNMPCESLTVFDPETNTDFTLDTESSKRLQSSYDAARENKEDTFIFEVNGNGHVFNTGYAGYLLEYLIGLGVHRV